MGGMKNKNCVSRKVSEVAGEVLGDNELNMGDTFDGLVQCLEDRFSSSKKELFKTLLWNRVQKPEEDYPELAYITS